MNVITSAPLYKFQEPIRTRLGRCMGICWIKFKSQVVWELFWLMHHTFTLHQHNCYLTDFYIRAAKVNDSNLTNWCYIHSIKTKYHSVMVENISDGRKYTNFRYFRPSTEKNTLRRHQFMWKNSKWKTRMKNYLQ